MPLLGSLRVMGAALLWTSAGWAAELWPAGLPPLALAEARLLVGGAALLLWVGPRSARAVVRMLPPRFLLEASLALAAFQWSFFSAVASLGPTPAVLLNTAIAPIAASALDARLNPRALGHGWWIALALLSAAAATLGGVGPAAPSGLVAAAASGLAYAWFARTTARMDAAAGRSPGGLVTTAVALTGAGLMLAPLAAHAAWPAPTWRSIAVVLYLGLVATAVGYALFARALRDMSADRALALLAVQPLAAMAGDLVLGSGGGFALRPLPVLLIAGALVARSIPWTLKFHRRRGPGTEPPGGPCNQCP